MIPNRFPYDIAAVEVTKEIEFNDQVQPIQYTAEEIPDGEEVVFTGWGKIRVIYTIQLFFYQLIEIESVCFLFENLAGSENTRSTPNFDDEFDVYGKMPKFNTWRFHS